MKRITFIFTILLSLIAMTSCENANVTKLKKEVATANAGCPINMGIGGDLLSIKYQEKENRVIFYYSVNEELGGSLFLKKNKDKLLQQFRLSFSKSESQQILKDVVNAKASLMMIYKAPSSGKTVKFELPYEELKELRANPMSDSEIQRLTIENKIEVENSRCPYKADEGTTTTKVALVDNYIVLLLSAKPYKSESNFLNGRSWAYFLYLTSPLSSFQELREGIPMLRRA